MIKTKRWDDPIEPDDGYRLLICRYRPRGLLKELETWEAWDPELGPSKSLLDAFHGKHGMSASWEIYKRTYLREMIKQRPKIRELAQRHKAGETITLLCSSQCLQESRCHRTLLKDLIEAEAEKM